MCLLFGGSTCINDNCAAINTLINNVKREKSRPADDSGVSCGLAPLSLTEELH